MHDGMSIYSADLGACQYGRGIIYMDFQGRRVSFNG